MGVIYDIMRRTRHQYQYAVRRAKKNDIMHRRRRLAETSSLNMWGELKRINPKGKSLYNVVNGRGHRHSKYVR